MEDSRSHLPVLLLAACGLFFLRLDCALLEPEEARYAEIPRKMLAADEWMVPAYHGQPYYDKPPLLYWLVMLSYSVFGVHDWSARVVPGICGVLTILTVYAWGRRVFDARTAFFAALVLALTPRFVYLGRFLATDAVLNLGVVAALMCLHTALGGARQRRWWIGAGLACGWGLLAKGPVVLALIAPPVAVYLALNARATMPRLSDICMFLGAMLLVAGPWYALMLGELGFAHHFFWKHHVQRFVEPFDHQKPFWFYLPDLLVGTLPWLLLLLPLGIRLAHGEWRSLCGQSSLPVVAPPGQARWRRWKEAVHELAGQSSLHRDKPAGGGEADDAEARQLMFPPLHRDKPAGGSEADDAKERQLLFPPLHRDKPDGGGEADDAKAQQLLFLPLHRDKPSGSGEADDAKARQLLFPLIAAAWCVLFFSASGSKRVGYILPCFAPLALAIGGEIEHRLRTRRLFRRALIAAISTTGGLCLLGVDLLLPRYNERFSLRHEVLIAGEQTPCSSGIVCYPRIWDSVPFYLDRDVLVFTAPQRAELVAYLQSHDDTVVFTRDDADSNQLVDELCSSLNVNTIAQRGGHRAVRICRRDLAPALASRREEK